MSVFRRSSHTHVQTEPSDEWTITHGMYCRPAVSVTIEHEGKVQTVLPLEVEIVDLQTVIVRFTKPQTGEARLG